MAGRVRNIAPESADKDVILSETVQMPRCKGQRRLSGKAGQRGGSQTARHTSPVYRKAAIPAERQREVGREKAAKRGPAKRQREGEESRKKGTTGRTKASVTKTDETTAAGIKTARREKPGRKQEGPDCGPDLRRRQKKQACAIAGPATRPEGRHTIFISAHPECASQRRESSYRPA